MINGLSIIDEFGVKYNIVNAVYKNTCYGCDKSGTCNIGMDEARLHYQLGIIYKLAEKVINFSTEELINELRSRGFKGVITKEEVITKKYEL